MSILSSCKIWLAIGLGLTLGWIPCALRAWTSPPTFPSIKPWPRGTPGTFPSRPFVDEWKWEWLNKWYGNSEDGVSGQQAWIWDANNQLVPYMPNAPAWARAYAWSMWRNNANNLKRPLRDDSLTGIVP